jgi:hypothetical protein
MKKIAYFAAALLFCSSVTSCEKEEIGGTATESMAGQWYVQIDAVDESGNPINGGEDYFGVGRTILLTYNTTTNSESEMWIDDLGAWNVAEAYSDYFPDFIAPTYCIKTKVNIDQTAMTFKSSESDNIGASYEWYDDDNNFLHGEYPMQVSIDGKILLGAGRQNNGSVADSIVFFVTYKNDPWYPDDGYAKYKVSGIRYSGLVEND